MTRRIGVFSGTFDPFHIAHLEACLVAKAACELETIAILVEKEPWRKVNVTPYEQRLAMIGLAIQEYPSLQLLEYEPSNIVINTALPILNRQFADAEYWYIVGSDIIAHLGDWESIDKLFASMNLCVILRDNHDEASITTELKNLKRHHRELNYRILPEVWSPISSSKIRNEVIEKGYSQYLHRDVLEYVLTHNIY